MSTPPFGFDGRVAVVTGAGRGIGRAYALLLGQRGAKVVVNDLGGSTKGAGHDPVPAQQVADEINAGGGTAIADSTDGYLHPDDVAPTIEDVAANWAAINDEAGYYVPTSTLNWSARYMSHRF
jgi:NAD(P)-dependent dehydrogenase (short-subunit alcohol dehydrogenase family)